MTTKKHIYVGYEGTCLDCDKELYDDIHVRAPKTYVHHSFFTVLREASKRRQKEWYVDFVPDLSYRGNELAGETGEACNIIKKLERERLGARGSRASIEELADELADVIICIEMIAGQLDINLEQAVIAKFNKTSEKYGLDTRMEQT